MSDRKKNLRIIAICLVVILLTGVVSLLVKNDMGNYTVKEVILSPYGKDLAASLYIPNEALETDENGNFLNKYPAVIVNAGFTNSRTFLDNVAISLVRCGFVVAHIDMHGHGMSESIDYRGYGNNPDPFSDDCSLMGQTDMLAYLRNLGFVDQSKIGVCGHSLGGSASDSMIKKSAGFFTLQDKLLILLNEEFGVSVTAEQVAAQDADAVAATLSAEDQAVYQIKKELLTEEYNIAVRNAIVFDGGGMYAPEVVEVAGVPVSRAPQANIGIIKNRGNGAGMKNPDAHLTNASVLSSLGVADVAKETQWYAVNLSSTEEAVLSTDLASMYDDPMSPALVTAAENHTLRVFDVVPGWHGWTYISNQTAQTTMQFFKTAFSYDNGSGLNSTAWLIKDIASAIGFFALILMIMPVAALVLDHPLYATLKGEPKKRTTSLKDPVLWVTLLICVFVPALTYSSGVGWAMKWNASFLSTVQVSTQVSFWSLVMTGILLVVLIAKYFLFDKKKFGCSFFELYGLKGGWKNAGKSVLFGLAIFTGVMLLLTAYYEFFAAGNLKITLGGQVIFTALSQSQLHSWLLYVIFCLPFFILNAMLVNSTQFEGLSEKKNTILVAAINASGMFLLAICQFLLGYMVQGKLVFAAPPGSSSTVYVITYMFVMLFISAIFNKKLYKKTGSILPGALMNAMLFTIPAIQAYAYYSL